MNRLFVIAGLVILVIALVFLGQGIKRSGLPDNDEDSQQQTQQASPSTPPAAARQAAAPPGAPSPTLQPEETLGNPTTAKHHITVGWVYTDANQQKPATLAVPLQVVREYVRRSGGSVSAQIVNVDVPAEDRSPASRSVTGSGIFVDGKPVIPGDVSKVPPQAVAGALTAASR